MGTACEQFRSGSLESGSNLGLGIITVRSGFLIVREHNICIRSGFEWSGDSGLSSDAATTPAIPQVTDVS